MRHHTSAVVAAASFIVIATVAPTLTQRPTEPIQPIEAVKVERHALVELGKKLYFDPRLSKSGFISCNSCHNLSLGGSTI